MDTDLTQDVRAEFSISADIYTEDFQKRLNIQRLQTAAMEGDWKTAEEIFQDPCQDNLQTTPLNPTGMTALHIASRCGKSTFVVKLVAMLEPRDLMQQDQQGRTALHYAASAASVEAAAAMVEKLGDLTTMEDADEYTPLFYAAKWRHPSKAKDMVEYLHEKTKPDVYDTYTRIKASNLIVAITSSGCHGIALKDLRKHPDLALVSNDSGWSILHVLASQPSPSLLSSENKPSRCSKSCIGSWMMNILYCRRCMKSYDYDKDSIDLIHFVCKKLQRKTYGEVMWYFIESGSMDPILHTATKNGVYELVRISLSYFPQLIWYSSGKKMVLLLHVAVEYRQVEIYNHIMKLVGGSFENYSETNAGGLEDQENILHLAAKLAPAQQLHSVPGPAFQMQKELQWFKAVEKSVYKDEKAGKNKEGLIPMELFFEKHKDLIKDAKEWMKDTSNSCMVIAALVATVAFASMITVPGGTNDSTGLPVFSNRVQFVVFSVSNALSMISSAIALLVFLSIQTSRYTEQDFMESLPKNLLIGLSTLFVAVATMMLAFALAIGMSLHTDPKLTALHAGVHWAYIPITLIACIPAIIFSCLQLPLLAQTLAIASRPGIYNTSKDPKLWNCFTKPNASRQCIPKRTQTV